MIKVPFFFSLAEDRTRERPGGEQPIEQRAIRGHRNRNRNRKSADRKSTADNHAVRSPTRDQKHFAAGTARKDKVREVKSNKMFKSR